jgi:transcriptional regulator with XRE-family HTH domain
MTITGAQLKAARQLLGWTQDKLAVEARLSPSTIGHFESGRRQPAALIVDMIKCALEDAGVEFTNGSEPGMKLRKAK